MKLTLLRLWAALVAASLVLTPALGQGTKISALPAASTLTGSELLPVVQGGVTKRASASALAALGGIAADPTSGVLVIVGDSIPAGYQVGGTTTESFGWPQRLGFPSGVAVHNEGTSVSGNRPSVSGHWVTTATSGGGAYTGINDDLPNGLTPFYDATKTCVALIERGINDLRSAGLSGPALHQAVAQIVARFQAQGFIVGVQTLLPDTDGASTPAVEIERREYNRRLRVDMAGADFLFDAAASSIMGGANAPNDTLIYQDKLHPAAQGHVYLAAAAHPILAAQLLRSPRATYAYADRGPLTYILSGAANIYGGGASSGGSGTSVASLAFSTTATFGAGKFGAQALTGGRATVPTSVLAANPAKPFTLVTWFKIAAKPSQIGVLLGATYDDGGIAFYAGVRDSDGRIGLSGSGELTGPVVTDGAWHELEIDVASGQIQGFLDGVSFGTMAGYGVSWGTLPLYYNSFYSGGTWYDFTGSQDALSIFNVVRHTANFTPDAAPPAVGTAGLLANYSFDSGDGSGSK